MLRLFLAALLAATTMCALDVKTYRELSRNSSEQADLDAHLEGFAAGLGYANAMLSSSGRQPIYCSPDKFTLNVKNLRDLMDAKIEDYLKGSTEAKAGTLDAQALLLVALIDAFPCAANAPTTKGSK